MNGLVTAIRTLTVLRVPGRDAENLGSAMPWFPVAGALVGGLLYGLSFLGKLGPFAGWPEAVAAVVVVAGFVITGGLHADGLADWADGFFGAREREKILRIMKDSAIGAFGALALITLVLFKWISVVRLLETNRTVWLVVAAVISRAVQVDLAVSQPYARAEGGTAGAFVQGAAVRHVVIALLVAVLLLSPLPCRGFALAALLLGLLIERWFGLRCRRRIGGVTGDLLGACSEIVETTVLAFGALAG